MTREIGRIIASSQNGEKRWTGEASAAIRPTKDSVSSRPSRISSRQVDLIESQLTDYDRGVVLFLSEVRLTAGHQVARRLWASQIPTDLNARRARTALTRLEGWRVIERLPRRMGGVRGGSASIVYALGPTGVRLLNRTGFQPRRLETPGDRYIRHTLSITELVVRLHKANLHGELDLIELQTEPTCWRGFLGLLGARLILKPDLFARTGAGALEDRRFFEVDLATEASGTILSKAKQYVAYYRSGEEQQRHGVFPLVVWVVPDRRRAEQIDAALSHLPVVARRLFLIWQFDEVVGRISAEALS
jgi:hypothetical protein